MKNEAATPRKLKISILRFNPREPKSVPRMVTYELDEAENMTLFIALSEIREKQEPSLEFDFVCRAGICGSCGMMINGRPTLACRTLTRDLGRRDLAGAAAGVRADRGLVGGYRQMDARYERAFGELAPHEGTGSRSAPAGRKDGAGARGKDL